MKFGRNLKLYMREQIKSKSVKLVDSLGNMRCFKWNHMSDMYTRFTDIVNSLEAL